MVLVAIIMKLFDKNKFINDSNKIKLFVGL